MKSIHQNYFRGKILGKMIFGLGVSIAIGLYPTIVRAQIGRAILREILNGDRVFIDETRAKIDEIATFRQEVSTQESLAGLEFDNGAVGRLAPQSSVIIGQCIEVRQGTLLASGPANGCTTTFEIGVQGTFYLLEVSDRGESQIKVLNGEVTIIPKPTESTSTSPSSQQPAIPQIIRAGEKLAVDREGNFGENVSLSQEEIEEILQDSLFQDFKSELPGMKNLQVSLERLYPGIKLPNLSGFKLIDVQPPIPGLW